MNDNFQDGPRRDPLRLFSNSQRGHIAARQQHACDVCTRDLPDGFHVHHVTPWSEGGLTNEANGVAVCPDCHRRAPMAALGVFEPRNWQREALPEVLPKLRAGEFATVSAAPGAGKTLFAGWTYRTLSDRGDIARIVVFVPNANLRTQWADVIKTLNVFLDIRGTTERRNRDGVVLTYHALSDPTQVNQLIEDARVTPTLFILDEVHHLAMAKGGEAGAWAVNIGRIVGSVDRPEHAVLNLSGTLFRSKPSEQITTIKYERVDDQVETVADYAITAGQLISELQLRHIKVLAYDATKEVSEGVNLAAAAHEGAEADHSVDIDGDVRLSSRVLSELIRNERFIKGILAETVTRLGHASMALENAPVKGLVIADNIEHADQIYALLSQEIGTRYAFLAHGQSANAEAEIQRFRMSTGQAIMVAVQKVTEGFDVPDICVLTYLRTWKAPLFINQMVGRAMRITDRERELDTYLPAAVLVPNDEEIKAAFADVLVGAMQVLTAEPEPCIYCEREVCACLPRPRDKICQQCNMPWRNCVCICTFCGNHRHHGCTCDRPWGRRNGVPINLEVIEDGRVVHVMFDGQEVDLRIIDMFRETFRGSGVIPEVAIEGAAAMMQQRLRADPFLFMSYIRDGRDE